MGVMVDTGVLIRFERQGVLFASSDLASDEKSFISSITISELLVGVELSDTEARRQRKLKFLAHARNIVSVLDFTSSTAKAHASIVAQLRRTGNMIGAHDLIIAATALEHGLSVITTNARNAREFQRVAGLNVIAFPEPA
jgi:tRNA(fMet)-specific endonuclease VapC